MTFPQYSYLHVIPYIVPNGEKWLHHENGIVTFVLAHLKVLITLHRESRFHLYNSDNCFLAFTIILLQCIIDQHALQQPRIIIRFKRTLFLLRRLNIALSLQR